MNTKDKKVLLAAGITGVLISLLQLVNNYTSIEALLVFTLFAAGLLYGLGTAIYLFTTTSKRVLWVIISGLSYYAAVYLTLSTSSGGLFPTPDPINYLYGSLLGAVILAAGYKMLHRTSAYGGLVCAVVAGAVVAFSAGSAPDTVLFLLLWPVWQVLVTWCLLRSGE